MMQIKENTDGEIIVDNLSVINAIEHLCAREDVGLPSDASYAYVDEKGKEVKGIVGIKVTYRTTSSIDKNTR